MGSKSDVFVCGTIFGVKITIFWSKKTIFSPRKHILGLKNVFSGCKNHQTQPGYAILVKLMDFGQKSDI